MPPGKPSQVCMASGFPYCSHHARSPAVGSLGRHWEKLLTESIHSAPGFSWSCSEGGRLPQWPGWLRTREGGGEGRECCCECPLRAQRGEEAGRAQKAGEGGLGESGRNTARVRAGRPPRPQPDYHGSDQLSSAGPTATPAPRMPLTQNFL